MTCKADTGRSILTNALFESPNWEADRWGNFKHNGRNLRFKFQDISVRLESKTQLGDWVKIAGAYYKDIQIVGKLVVLGTRRFGLL